MDCCKFQEPTGVKTKFLNKTKTKFRDEHLAECGVTTTPDGRRQCGKQEGGESNANDEDASKNP
jgi:hypothetical protein